MKKIGIITFHSSYNCGSMLESYAIQKFLQKHFNEVEIIDYSSKGQKELYMVFDKKMSIKSIIKNLLILPHYKQILLNNAKYEEFKNKYFTLSNLVNETNITDACYDFVIAGSDQIWNVTIDDYNDVYLLSWVKKAKRIAYAPSFGAKNPMKFYHNPDKFAEMLKNFDELSIREFNGKKWIKEMTNLEVPVLLDPTLLLEKKYYDEIIDTSFNPDNKYIFFYAPAFKRNICLFVKQISKKYNMQVITWSSKSFYYKRIKDFGFKLPPYESPSLYLNLIKNAELVLTTSFHGTIFSTIYKKCFFTLKNGGMYGDDDRVKTLLKILNMEDRLISCNFEYDYNYLKECDYSLYESNLKRYKEQSEQYLLEAIKDIK